jgi:hypothetical protein
MAIIVLRVRADLHVRAGGGHDLHAGGADAVRFAPLGAVLLDPPCWCPRCR